MINAGAAAIAGLGEIETNAWSDMAALDQLPQPVRRALRDLPYDVAAAPVLEAWLDSSFGPAEPAARAAWFVASLERSAVRLAAENQLMVGA